MPVEVAPIAHYHMGGVVADERMATEVPGLLVAGEAVGGANGANRLSGNAITEALVFGRRAGRSAAERVDGACRRMRSGRKPRGRRSISSRGGGAGNDINTAAMIHACRRPCRTTSARSAPQAKLERALATIEDMTRALGERPVGDDEPFDLRRLEWFDLRNMLLVARAVTMAALARERKPRRPPARGFSGHAAALARQPGRAARRGAASRSRRCPRSLQAAAQ